MNNTVIPSKAQLITLRLLLQAFNRQSSFERQAARHPSVKNLSADTITSFWIDHQYKRKAAPPHRAQPPPSLKLDSSAFHSAGGSQVTSLSPQVKVENVAANGLPTPITPTNGGGGGVSFSAFPFVPKSESVTPKVPSYTLHSPVKPLGGRSAALQWMQGSLPRHQLRHQLHFDSIQIFPTCLTIGNVCWRLFDPEMELLGAELESNGGGALTVDIMTTSTIERMRIPISSLAAITLDSCCAILTLAQPPQFYKRPRFQNDEIWQLAPDPSPYGIATSAVHFSLALALSQHTPDFVNHPLLFKTPILVLPTFKTGDPNKLAFPPQKPRNAPFFVDQLSQPFQSAVFGVGTQSVSTAVPPFPVASPEPYKPTVFIPSYPSFSGPPPPKPTLSAAAEPVVAESKPFAVAVKKEEEVNWSPRIAGEFVKWFKGTSERLDGFGLDFGGEGWVSEQLGANQQKWSAW